MFKLLKGLRRLTELEEALETLSRQLRSLKADHDELWGRFQRYEGREKKRAQRTEPEAVTESPDHRVTYPTLEQLRARAQKGLLR